MAPTREDHRVRADRPQLDDLTIDLADRRTLYARGQRVPDLAGSLLAYGFAINASIHLPRGNRRPQDHGWWSTHTSTNRTKPTTNAITATS